MRTFVQPKCIVKYTDRAGRMQTREYSGMVSVATLYRRIALAGGSNIRFRRIFANGKTETGMVSNGITVYTTHESFDKL